MSRLGAVVAGVIFYNVVVATFAEAARQTAGF
jgi:hypothetical protein